VNNENSQGMINMSKNIEIEKKNLLTEQEYKLIYNEYNLDKEPSFTQVNMYFDTREKRLKINQAALRIRTKEAFAEMTLKIPHKNHLLEVNESLTLEEAEKIINQKRFLPKNSIIEEMKKLGLTNNFEVYFLTALKTTRIEKELPKGLLVLDQSWYNGQTDYELEVEASNEQDATRLFQKILTDLSIEERDTSNKIARAMSSIN